MNQFLICCFLLVGSTCVHDNEERRGWIGFSIWMGMYVISVKWNDPGLWLGKIFSSVQIRTVPKGTSSKQEHNGCHRGVAVDSNSAKKGRERNGCHRGVAGGTGFHLCSWPLGQLSNNKKEAGAAEGQQSIPPQKFSLNLNSTGTEVFLIIYFFK